jgi:hypothetical protein
LGDASIVGMMAIGLETIKPGIGKINVIAVERTSENNSRGDERLMEVMSHANRVSEREYKRERERL